jgi:hypothetical protein
MAPIASVDQVREELRRLGYLDSGLDRFVLGGGGRASPVGALFRVGLRVGLVGGALLGLVFTLAAVALDRPLLSEPADLAVLALYLSATLGAGSALAVVFGGLGAVWIGGRLSRKAGPHLSRNVGLAVAVFGLAYLALWWRSHALAAPLLAQTAAVVVGLGLSLILWRFGSLAVVAVLSAGGLSDQLPEASLSRRRVVPLLALALLLFGGGLAASRLGAPGGPPPPDFAVVPTGLRVRLLGIDGLEARMTEELLKEGRMERLKGLLESGARGRLKAEPEQIPAIVWTTIATGRGPEAHGIHSLGARRLPGMKTPLASGGPFASTLETSAELLRITRTEPPSSRMRSVKAFWNVASEKGLRVGIVNWWATWPPDAVTGFLVTDRAFFKLEKGGAPDREVFPPEDFDALKGLLGTLPQEDRPRRLDRFQMAAARALGAREAPDLEAVYLPGLDIVTMQQLGGAGGDLAALSERVSAVKAYYAFVDQLIGEALDGLRPGDILVLVGDPGRFSRRSGHPEGIFAAYGAPVVQRDLGVVSERDVAPTLLDLVGLPISRELDGRVLDALVSEAFRLTHPVRTVAGYGRRPRLGPTESAFDPEVVQELKSLGYIQ